MRWTTMSLVVALAACGPVELGEDPGLVGARRDEVVSGHVTLAEPSVFMLSIRYGSDGYLCTSTLIAPRVLLTAAHCVAPENGMSPTVYASNAVDFEAAHGGWIKASGLRWHPDFNLNSLDADIAVVALEREPPAPVTPANFDDVDLTNAFITVVGYGLTSTFADDAGLKRSGLTRVSAFDAKTFEFGRVGTKVQSGTCSGDSGGPSLYVVNGERRVIGVHSFHSGECGQNTDRRVDAYTDKVTDWIRQLTGPTCAADGQCAQGCTLPDPDCACVEDGACGASCTAPSLDPDCESTCGADGVCSAFPCAVPDPDCQPVGESCGQPHHCADRLCITSAQHPVPYCSRHCSTSSDCPSALTCEAGECRFPVLPEAALGEACMVGQTYCGGLERVCATWERDSAPKCAQLCYAETDCGKTEACVASPQAPGICVPNIELPHLKAEALPAAAGCSSVPVFSAFPLVLLLGLRRRRRTSS